MNRYIIDERRMPIQPRLPALHPAYSRRSPAMLEAAVHAIESAAGPRPPEESPKEPPQAAARDGTSAEARPPVGAAKRG